MKKLLLLILFILFLSCERSKYNYIGQTIIDGKVSARKEGHIGKGGYLPSIWIQNATFTQKVYIPHEYEGKWKVGDSCLLIIEKYEIVKDPE